MLTSEQKDLLHLFVTGEELTEAQEQRVYDWLRADKAFRIEYQKEALVQKAIRRRNAQWAAGLVSPKKVPVEGRQIVLSPAKWAVAASVVCLLGLGWWLMRPSPQPGTDVAAETRYLPATGPLREQVVDLYETYGTTGLANQPRTARVDQIRVGIRTTSGPPTYAFPAADSLTLFLNVPLADSLVVRRMLRLSETEYLLETTTGWSYALQQGRKLTLALPRPVAIEVPGNP